MTLVKYTRRRPVLSLYDDMNGLFNQLWSRPFIGDAVLRNTWSPAFIAKEPYLNGSNSGRIELHASLGRPSKTPRRACQP